MSIKQKTTKPIQPRSFTLSLGLQFVLAGLFCLAAYKSYIAVGNSSSFILFLAIGVSCVAALTFRWGPLLPCTLLGAILGTTCMVREMMPRDVHSQPSDIVRTILTGTVIGFVIGLFFDAISGSKSEVDDG